MDKEELQKVLENHRLWLSDCGGKCANLSGANLYGANLYGANLRYADLSGAFLENADLRYANLKSANLSGANLSCANLKSANLCGANLYGADLCGTNLYGANLRSANLKNANPRSANLSCANLAGADLSGVKYSENIAFLAMQCPEEGAFVAWKKCKNNVIVKLLIPDDASRSSATSRKCRASKAVVLEVIGAEKGISTSDETFVYEVGKEVVPDSFDEDRWNECSHGIHFFPTRKEAEDY